MFRIIVPGDETIIQYLILLYMYSTLVVGHDAKHYNTPEPGTIYPSHTLEQFPFPDVED